MLILERSNFVRTVKPVKVGNACLDGSHIYIQSMLNARSDDISGSVAQAVALEQAGCEILRAAIPNQEAIALIPAIKQATHIPLVADISCTLNFPEIRSTKDIQINFDVATVSFAA